MLRSVVVLLVGTVASSLGCIDLQITYENPPEACLPPSSAPTEGGESARPEPLPSPPTFLEEIRAPAIDDELDLLEIAIWDCFETEREGYLELEGTLVIEFDVAVDGHVTPPVESETTWTASEGFISCVRYVIEDHVFSEPGGVVKMYRLR